MTDPMYCTLDLWIPVVTNRESVGVGSRKVNAPVRTVKEKSLPDPIAKLERDLTVPVFPWEA